MTDFKPRKGFVRTFFYDVCLFVFAVLAALYVVWLYDEVSSLHRQIDLLRSQINYRP